MAQYFPCLEHPVVDVYLVELEPAGEVVHEMRHLEAVLLFLVLCSNIGVASCQLSITTTHLDHSIRQILISGLA